MSTKLRISASAALAALLTISTFGHAAVPPVAPGYEQLRASGKADAATLGQVLLGELNCVSCHASDSPRITTKAAPDLSDVGARITPQYLRAYMLKAHSVKPGATMPDLFHASGAERAAGAVDFLLDYLVSLGGPIAPSGYAANQAQVDAGKELFHSVGCVACHAPEEALQGAKVASVPLANLAMKTTVEKLSAFLQNPLKVRHGGRMPSLNLSPSEADLVAVYLLRDQLNNPQNKTAKPVPSPGVRFELYTGDFGGHLPDFDAHKPVATGKVDRFMIDVPARKVSDNFGFRYSGNIAIPREGKYRFSTTSDDGSQLFIDGKLIVNNDGVHPPKEASGEVELKPGAHAIIVTFFEAGGGEELAVRWEGPDISKQEIPANVLSNEPQAPMVPLASEPFTVDPRKAMMGKQMFVVIGCASCHGVPGAAPGASVALRKAKPLSELNVKAADGCLGDNIRREAPNYDLSAEQRTALAAALSDQAGLNKPMTSAERITHTMATLNCFACHNRDGVGGPDEARTKYFQMTAPFDMGEEGYLPPRLTGVGAKLQHKAIERILYLGELHVRPYMATRMPVFGEANLTGLVDALDAVDGAVEPASPPLVNMPLALEGRQLVGTKGLGCVNCHGVNGVKSPGMPAVDLGTVYERLRQPWFDRLLQNPAAINANTRMPTYWAQGIVAFKDLGGGTMKGQIDAMWMYLSLGKTMPLPIGLKREGGEFELVPVSEPLVHRTFMGGVSVRAILVGYPELVHVAFDAQGVRLAKAWRGRFFDAGGMWNGRGGKHNGPLGTDVIDMPPGPAVAILDKPDSPWPQIGNNRDVGGKYLGYNLDKELVPIFKYQLEAVTIHEQAKPLIKAGGASLLRHFEIMADSNVPGVYMLAGQGANIESLDGTTWRIGDMKVRITGAAPVIRTQGNDKQLLIPVQLNNGKATFDVELTW